MSRKEVHEEIARFLQEKIQEKIQECGLADKYSFTCSADENGIYFKVLTPSGYRLTGEKNEIEKMFREIGLVVNPTIYDKSSKSPAVQHILANTPSRIEDLLKQLDSEKAKRYHSDIETQNVKIANSLNRLTKQDEIEWRTSFDDGVFCEHRQAVPKEPLSIPSFADRARHYFLSNLKSRGINDTPHIEKSTQPLDPNNPRSVSLKISFNGSSIDQIEGELKVALEKKLDAKTPLTICSEYQEKCKNEYPEDYRDSLSEEVCKKIVELSEKHPNMDGLKEMRDIINNRPPLVSYENILEQVIKVANWKKSDSDFMKSFHKFRGRSAEAENFYQKLADLDPKDTTKIENFKDTMEDILPPKTEENRGYGCW